MSKTKETEKWKSLDFLGFPNYEVSNLGNVKSLNYNHTEKEGILKPAKNRDGYSVISLHKNNKQKHFLVHRLVALAFIPNIQNLPQINHKDENKKNNRVENLEWVTPKENCNYGTIKERKSKKLKGKNNPMYGKHHTEETKQKMRDSHKGKSNYKRCKPIQQYTKDMVFIREWDSATLAEKELNIHSGNITKCCKGKLKTCGNFIWKYKE